MPLRVVLDTNVWLDWLVFNDAGLAPLQALVSAGKAEIIIDADCDADDALTDAGAIAVPVDVADSSADVEPER